MSKLGINTGSSPNDGQGDSLRDAMGKINHNFTEIYDTFGDGNTIVSYAGTAGISTLAENLTGRPRVEVSGILNTGITTTEHIEVRNITSTGIVTAVQFVGDGSQLSNVVSEWSGVDVLDDSVRKGVARELNFGNGLYVGPPDGVGRVLISLTTSVVSGGGTGGSGTPLEFRNQNAILGTYSKVNFDQNLLAYVNPAAGVVTVTTAPNINISGVVTATQYFGDGSNLTGISATFTGAASTITNTQIQNWDTTYGWGDHSVVGYTTTGYVDNAVAEVATFSGDYNDLSNKPTIPSDTGDLTNNVGFITSGSLVGYATEGYADSVISGLASEGYVDTQIGIRTFSGNYNDLTNQPTIPVNIADLSDVNAGSPSTGQVLKWSGSEWTAAADLVGEGGAGIGLSDLSVTISPAGINSLTYNSLTGVFQFTPTDLSSYVTSSGSVSYASSSGTSGGLTGTPNISVNEVGISSYLSVTGVSSFYNNVHIESDRTVLIGDNDELQLFHSGVDSYIDNNSPGNLIIRDSGLGIQLRRSGGGPSAGLMAAFNNDAGVELYYNSVLKLETFENGVAINDSVGIGTTSGNPPYRLTVSGIGATVTQGLLNAIADLTSSVDGYGQVNIRNSRSAANASGDLVITADTGTDLSDYINLGINNTGFTTSSWTINGPLDGYLYTSDRNISIGAASAGRYVSLFAGDTLIENEKVRVTEDGVGIGSTQPTSMLAVSGDVSVSGVITATSFSGSGANLTGVITSLVGYATEGYVDTAVAGVNTFTGAATTITTTQIGNWDTAYSWGNHASQGYLTNVNISAGSNIDVVETSEGNFIITATSSGSVGSAGTWAVNASGIHTSKNVGIGTEVSNSALWVEGDGRFSGVVTATRFESASAGTPTIDSPNNVNINAITVAISTNLTVGESIVGGGQTINSTGVQVTGVVTATSFVGDGSNLTGISFSETDTLASVTLRGNTTSDSIIANYYESNDTAGDGSDIGFAIKYYITANGTSAFRFAGPALLNTTDNPTFYLQRGFTYIFENSTGTGHPFRIQFVGTTIGVGTYVSGSQTGTQYFTVPFDAPSAYEYQCTLHSGMLGTFNVA